MALLDERRGPVADGSAPRRRGLSMPIRPSSAIPVALAIIVAVAAALRVWGLTRQGLWYDEAMTGWLVRLPVGRMLGMIPRTESTPPLYYLVAWGWVRVFGDDALGLRSLSALVGVLAVPVTFAAGRLIAGPRAGLAAAVLVAVDPILVWYAQEARAYALLVLLSALTLWLVARARERPTPPRLAAWTLAAAAALWTHYFALFLIAPQAVWLLSGRRDRLPARLVATALPFAAAIPLVSMVHQQRGHATLFHRVVLRIRVEQIAQELFAGFTPPAPIWALWAMSAAATAAIAAAVVLGRRGERRAALVTAGIGATAIGAPLLLALGGTDVLDARNVLGAVVPLAVAAGIGLTLRPLRHVGLAILTAMVAASGALLLALAHDPAAQRPHWQQVAAALRSPRPHVIVLVGKGGHLPLAFMLPRTWSLPRHGERVDELFVVRHIAPQACTGIIFWGAVCEMRPHHLPGHLPGHGWRRVGEQRMAGFAVTRYRTATPVLVRPPRWPRHHHRNALYFPRAQPAYPHAG